MNAPALLHLGPGLHLDIPAARYHADPCAEPSLSSSTAWTLYERTPLHAWHGHPRLNPDFEPDEGNSAMALGSVAHELILGRGGGIVVVDADDWRKKAAQEQRDAAAAEGRTAVLKGTMADAERLRDAVFRELRRRPACADFFDPGSRSEVVAIWRDIGGPLCRAMFDRLTPAGTIYDVKVTGRDLSDHAIERALAEDGYACRAAFYVRGATALHPEMAGRIRYRWIFVEAKAPHAVRVVTATPAALTMGDWQAALSVSTWDRCLRSGDWGAYPAEVEPVGMPGWAEGKITTRKDADPDWRRAKPLGAALPDEPDHVIYGEARVPLPPIARGEAA